MMTHHDLASANIIVVLICCGVLFFCVSNVSTHYQMNTQMCRNPLFTGTMTL